jgi:hypothetical protein
MKDEGVGRKHGGEPILHIGSKGGGNKHGAAERKGVMWFTTQVHKPYKPQLHTTYRTQNCTEGTQDMTQVLT